MNTNQSWRRGLSPTARRSSMPRRRGRPYPSSAAASHQCQRRCRDLQQPMAVAMPDDWG